MKRWARPENQVQCFGTVDSYDGGNVQFLTHILTSGEILHPEPSITRAMAIALVHSMDKSKVGSAFEALVQIGFGDLQELDTSISVLLQPLSFGQPMGNHDLMPIDFDDD